MTDIAMDSAPVSRFDAQGDYTDDQRVERAMRNFAKDFGRTAALYMEACIHCGACAKACHFYTATEDPKYTPILKIEPFKQAYKREAGPLAFFYKAFNLKPKVTADELQEWQELLYDSCTLCGRCTLICPMGIDIADLVRWPGTACTKPGWCRKTCWRTSTRNARSAGQPGASAQNTISSIRAQALRSKFKSHPGRQAEGRHPRLHRAGRVGSGRRRWPHREDPDSMGLDWTFSGRRASRPPTSASSRATRRLQQRRGQCPSSTRRPKSLARARSCFPNAAMTIRRRAGRRDCYSEPAAVTGAAHRRVPRSKASRIRRA